MNGGKSAEFNTPIKDASIKQLEGKPDVKVFETLARANGIAYNSLMDILLSADNEQDKQRRFSALVEGLPLHARNLYRKGLNLLQNELRKNHAFLEQHAGGEIKYLFENRLRLNGKSQKEINEILNHIIQDNARFIQPTEGVALIQVEPDLYSYFKNNHVVDYGSEAMNFSGSDSNPVFMVTQRLKINKRLDEEKPISQDKPVRHEFHHFIWDLLVRSNFVRIPHEASPELSKAFYFFRNELAAHIITGRDLLTVPNSTMIYASKKDLLKLGGNAKLFASACMKIAQQTETDLSLFLYPTMISKTFAELKSNFLKLTPLSGLVDADTVNLIYNVCNQAWYLDIFKEILEKKGASISTDTMKQIGLRVITKGKASNLPPDYFKHEAIRLAEFSSAMGIEGELSSITYWQDLIG